MTDKLKSYIKTKIKLKDFIKLVIALVQFPVVLCAFIASKFDRTIPSKVWLIGEEGPDAKDNAFMFFQYLREQHADIPTAYYLTKDSPVFETVTKYGEVVEHSSFRHMKMMFKARYVLSTHDGHFAPWKQINWREFKILYSWLNPKLEFVFLQHGVTKDNVEKNAGFARTRFDFFVTTTKDEYKAISDPELGYRNGQVIETGFSRFDNLYKRINEPTKNYILIMPTWRYYLSEASENDFASSDYFKNYMALLSNKELIQFLNEQKLKLLFYPPHTEIRKYLDLFSVSDKSHVEIVDTNEKTVQEAILESKMMITDYSSVAFDFAFLHKPVLYFHFDYQAYRANHYQQGYFEYKKDGFGPIFETTEAVVEEIKKASKNKFKLSNKYLDRIDRTFDLFDDHNSERLFLVLKKEATKL